MLSPKRVFVEREKRLRQFVLNRNGNVRAGFLGIRVNGVARRRFIILSWLIVTLSLILRPVECIEPKGRYFS
jgi:hypothetical protein